MIPAIEERADELNRLCLTYGVRRLDLFGSASTGLYDGDESDLSVEQTRTPIFEA